MDDFKGFQVQRFRHDLIGLTFQRTIPPTPATMQRAEWTQLWRPYVLTRPAPWWESEWRFAAIIISSCATRFGRALTITNSAVITVISGEDLVLNFHERNNPNKIDTIIRVNPEWWIANEANIQSQLAKYCPALKSAATF